MFKKNMSAIELEVSLRASSLGIGPNIISWQQISYPYIIREYDQCSDELSEWENWKCNLQQSVFWYSVIMDRLDITLNDALVYDMIPKGTDVKGPIGEKIMSLIDNDIIHLDMHCGNIMYYMVNDKIDYDHPYIIDYGFIISKDDWDMFPLLQRQWNVDQLMSFIDRKIFSNRN